MPPGNYHDNQLNRPSLRSSPQTPRYPLEEYGRHARRPDPQLYGRRFDDRMEGGERAVARAEAVGGKVVGLIRAGCSEPPVTRRKNQRKAKSGLDPSPINNATKALTVSVKKIGKDRPLASNPLVSL